MKNIKIHNKNKLPTIQFTDLRELQEDFKVTTQQAVEKLAKRVIETGFKYPAFIYISTKKYKDFPKNTKFIIDAHSRMKALHYIQSIGYEIPKIPYFEVSAKNIEEAKKEILYLNSNYSEIDFDSNFFLENFEKDLDFNLGLDNVDLQEFEGDIDDFFEEQSEEQETKIKTITCPKCEEVIELK